MAGALIGEAFISSSIQVICERIASPDFIDLFRHKKLDQPLLMKLKRTLLTLNAVLDDAEEKQIEKPAVREWLDDLKHAVFDAEDLLDEINYESLRCKLEGEAQTADKFTNKVWNFLPTSRNKFYQSMNVKIQELLRKLEDFVQLKGALGLTEVVGRKVSQRTPTTSLVHEPFVYALLKKTLARPNFARPNKIRRATSLCATRQILIIVAQSLTRLNFAQRKTNRRTKSLCATKLCTTTNHRREK